MNESISAASAVFGVLIGSVFSYYIARLQFRAMTISANRQSWINTLRDCIAEIQHQAAIAMEEGRLAHDPDLQDAVDADAHKDALRTLDLMGNKIRLLLNPKETEHQKLVELVAGLTRSCIIATDDKVAEYDRLQRDVTSQAQGVLKHEWQRVKKGK